MYDAATLQQKLDDHTQTMIHSHDGSIDPHDCEARAWMYAGMEEIIQMTAFDAALLRWLSAQQRALIKQADEARSARFPL